MEERFVILAIHTPNKAFVLKHILENRGVSVFMEELSRNNQNIGFIIKIRESQIIKALTIIEENRLFNYSDAQTYKIDDGRKRVLVAVDFSSYSMKACRIAFSIAKKIDAKVKILHIYNNIYFPSHIPFADTLKKEGDIGLLDKSRKKMLDLCFEIDKNIADGNFPSVNYSYSLKEGIIEEEIDSFINEYKPILLILGTKGNNNSNNILGSVTADLIEMTNIPVLAIPEKTPINDVEEVRHLAFFTSIHKRDLLSFDYLANYLLLYKKLKVTLVHVVKNAHNNVNWTEAELNGLKEFLNKKYEGLNVTYKMLDNSDIIPEIKKFIEKENVNIVAVNTRRRNIWGRIFIPSNSRKILASLDVALLVLRGDSFRHL